MDLTKTSNERLFSLDLFRGITMFLLVIEWYLCYWLYRRKIFIKI